MWDQLNALIRPRSTDEETARREFLLNVATWVLGLAAGAGALLGLALIALGTARATILLIVGASTALASSIIWNLNQHGHLRAAAILLPMTIWGTVTILIAWGGWPTPLILGYALCVALSVLVGGPLHGVIWIVLSVLAYGLVGRQWIAGRLPDFFPAPEKSLNINLFILSAGLTVLGLLFYALNRQLGRMSEQRQAETRHHADELEKATHEREELNARLQKTAQEQEQLLHTIRTISAPVLPLAEGLIVMPIVGELDMVRARLLLDDMLTGIARYRANFVLLDLTGLSALDVESARELVKAIQGAQMLGCRCYLVGVQPTTAQALIDLNIDLTVPGCYSTLQEGVADLLAQIAASLA